MGGKHAKRCLAANAGLTLMELIIAIVLSGVVLVGIFRIFNSNSKSYNLQEQINDMHQNAQYAIKRLSEELMQVGADLPDTNYTYLFTNSTVKDSIALMVNKRGAKQVCAYAVPSSRTIPIDNAKPFIGAEKLIKMMPTRAVTTYLIDKSYTTALFVKGIDTASETDSIRLTTPAFLLIDDIVFATESVSFFKDSIYLCMNSANNHLAENIDSLAIVLLDISNNPTTTFRLVRAAHIYVRARTAHPDIAYHHPLFGDGYRRVEFSMDVRLRNKIK